MSKDEKFNKWLRLHAMDSGVKIKQSQVYLSLVTENALKDPLCALQLGFAILFDKPIMLIVNKDAPVPKHLEKIAVAIERVDLCNPDDIDRAQEAIKKLVESLGARA